MDPKYKNIFWHQGVKIFANPEKNSIKVSHLENDVTKALLNLFEHCSGKVLQAFLQLIGIKQAPETFEYDFQVKDTRGYREKSKRMMISIIFIPCSTDS